MGSDTGDYRNPLPTVDLLIQVRPGTVVLVERANEPKGWALPGGFVDWGETLEHAAIREAKEETGLDVTLGRQLHSYSDPKRDPRHHTITTVFIATAAGEPEGGDDAAQARVFALDALPQLVFDHAQIIEDWVDERY